MLVTNKGLAKVQKENDHRIEWWVDRQRDLQKQLWELEARHYELLKFLELEQVKVKEHYEIRCTNG